MKTLSRRDLLKSSLLAPAAVAARDMGPVGAAAIHAAGVEPATQSSGATPKPSTPGAGRERLLLDFGWRFYLGNANDPVKDFAFGMGRSGSFQKTGNCWDRDQARQL
jgi:beta-galactosidase